jgi:hypothetical protein
MRIHVTEEARHICFAREYLRHRVPLLSPRRRLSLALQAPFLLNEMARQMMHPSAHVVRTYGIPPEVVAEAFTKSDAQRTFVMASLSKVRELCVELGLVTPFTRPVGRRLGLVCGARARSARAHGGNRGCATRTHFQRWWIIGPRGPRSPYPSAFQPTPHPKPQYGHASQYGYAP